MKLLLPKAPLAGGLALALALSAPVEAASGSPALTARPGAVQATSYPAGLTRLGHDALLYRPANVPAGPLPVIVLLPGFGQISDDFLNIFRPEADRGGFMLLALQSKGQTWDLVPEKRRGSGTMAVKLRPRFRFGEDVPRIDAVLAEFFAKAAVDPNRVVLLGFSDGASYALSLGLANPQLFRAIVALSPGFVVTPSAVDLNQRIFVAHGTRDPVLPFETAERDIIGLLADVRLNPKFRPFDGDHRIDREALAEGLAYALAQSGS